MRFRPTRAALCLALGIWSSVSIQASSSWPAIWMLLLAGFWALLGQRSLWLCAIAFGGLSMSWDLRTQHATEARWSAQLDDRESESLVGKVAAPVSAAAGRRTVLFELEDDTRVLLTVYADDDQDVEELLPGQRYRLLARLFRPRDLRLPGAPDPRLAALAIGAELRATARAHDLELVGREPSWWRLPEVLHRKVLSNIDRAVPASPGRALVKAIATGDRAELDPEVTADLRTAGIAHLLAVSGMHLGAVVWLVFALTRLLWACGPLRDRAAPQSVAAGCAWVAAVCFALFTGAQPSTLRACLVASFFLLGILTDRRLAGLDGLGLAAMLLLAVRPALLWSPGFQLSFAAAYAVTLAVAGASTAPRGWAGALAGRFSRLLRASLMASLVTMPLGIWHFDDWSYLGPLTNLFAVPLVAGVVLPMTLVGAMLSMLWFAPGAAILKLAEQLATMLLQATEAVCSLFPETPRLVFGPLAMVVFAALVAGLLWPRVSPRLELLRRPISLVLVGTLVVILWSSGRASSRSLRVTFLDVGQGDAAVVQLPGGQVWLVDGGGLPFALGKTAEERQFRAEAPARRSLLPFLRSQGIEAIDLAIVSHPHPDHYIGLQALSREMPIRELWTTSRPARDEGAFSSWLLSLEFAGTRVLAPPLGHARVVSDASLQVLWPRFEAWRGRAAADPVLSVNDNSLVVRIDFAGRSLLFGGDLEAEGERLLSQHMQDRLRADVVKVAHHGSATSSTAELVAAARPALAIISCGVANRFEFPAPEVEARWDAVGEVLRTDRVGTVQVEVAPSGAMSVSTVDPI